MMPDAQILWERLITPGHETAWIRQDVSSWSLAGTAVFADAGRPCRLDYRVRCDTGWRTLSTRVEGWIGTREVAVSIEVDEAGQWTLNGENAPAVQGCTDIDLNFSPSTNLLPIRRLGLDPGAEASVRAAWLRFPSFELEPLEQVYRRTAADRYRYESGGGSFVAELQVDGHGLVTDYPGGWRAVPLGRQADGSA
jgi:uncharacterized protein